MTIPEGFKLVHQGGHHDVHCDGVEHIVMSGGFAGIATPGIFKRKTFCDCHRYQPGGDMYVDCDHK